ncbi:MAG: protein translocase subunit SecD [Formosimonas sp.]
MNRYPLWKYLIMLLSLVLGVLFTVPNFFGTSSAVQVSAAKATVKITKELQPKLEQALAAKNLTSTGIYFNQIGNTGSFRLRFADKEAATAAKDALNLALNAKPDEPEYITALNSMSSAPDWLSRLGANPMSLGLDLRGGIHFLLKVDMNGAIQKRLDGMVNELNASFKEQKFGVQNVEKTGDKVTATFDSPESVAKAAAWLMQNNPNLLASSDGNNLVVSMSDKTLDEVKVNAVKQNISTLHNRVNELGVSEPIVQQQGQDRIVVELPGVEDSARAKNLIGKTATLQIRLGDTGSGFGSETFLGANGNPVKVKKQVVVSGDAVISAQASTQEGRPVVAVGLDSAGGKAMLQTTSENVNRPMAIILFEQVKGQPKGQVISYSNIAGVFGENFVISGSNSIEEANDLAVLLRAGALAAPMEFIEESSVGPSLGKDNIAKGLNSLLYGFLAIAVFIIIYYHVFGMISVISLAVNLLLLVGILSKMGATMTLPGIAAIALTLGMAIDSNVLINERIREELRAGLSPQQAIFHGYERAFATILDSNITTLIAGLALLIFGTGPIRGFAVVHCLGILTSMFSAVFFSRGLANLIYGRRARLQKISIGSVWRGDSKAGV